METLVYVMDSPSKTAKMIDTKGPVIFDCRVATLANCFPMIPSGKAHNEMLLGEAETQGVIDSKGSVLV